MNYVHLFWQIAVEPHVPNPHKELIGTLVLETDMFQKRNMSPETFNTDQLAKSVIEQFNRHCFTAYMPMVLKYQDKKALSITPKEIEG